MKTDYYKMKYEDNPLSIYADLEKEIENEPPQGGLCDCKKLNVRSNPNQNADVTLVIDSTYRFTVGKIEDGWVLVHVDIPNSELGLTGYVMEKYIKV